MPKIGNLPTTRWDPDSQDWTLVLTPTQVFDPHSPIAQFIINETETAQTIDLSLQSIKDIEAYIEHLTKDEKYQKIKKQKEKNLHAILTGNSPAYSSGFLAKQTTLTIAFLSTAIMAILPLIRGIQFLPYQATAEEIKQFNDNTRDIVIWIFITALVSAFANLIGNFIVNKQEQNQLLSKQKFDSIEDIISRLKLASEEISLKKRVFIKLLGLLAVGKDGDISIGDLVKDIDTDNQEYLLKKSHSSATIRDVFNAGIDAIANYYDIDRSLPIKIPAPPKTLQDWIMFTLDSMHDLEIYHNLDKILTGSQLDDELATPLLHILKCDLLTRYSNKNLQLDRKKIMATNSIYDLLILFDKLLVTRGFEPPIFFLIKNLITRVVEIEKLKITIFFDKIFSNLQDKEEKTDETAIPVAELSFLKIMNALLKNVSNDSGTKITKRIVHLANNENEGKAFNEITKDYLNKMLTNTNFNNEQEKHQAYDQVFIQLLQVLEHDTFYEKFKGSRNLDFMRKNSSFKQSIFFQTGETKKLPAKQSTETSTDSTAINIGTPTTKSSKQHNPYKRGHTK